MDLLKIGGPVSLHLWGKVFERVGQNWIKRLKPFATQSVGLCVRGELLQSNLFS